MIKVDIQRITSSKELPENRQIRNWIKKCLSFMQKEDAQLTVRIVDEEEGTRLNETWRNKNGPTNVLSFQYGDEQYTDHFIGDMVLCAPVIFREAGEQNKSPESHWAHMIIHGTLHLLGYDHIKAEEAEEMESLEVRILESLGYKNPYHFHETV